MEEFKFIKLIKWPISIGLIDWTRSGVYGMLSEMSQDWRFHVRGIGIGPWYIALIDGRKRNEEGLFFRTGDSTTVPDPD